MKRIPLGCFVIWLYTITLFTGCGHQDSVTRIDASDAEFSSPEDYAQYDAEMAELSAGQQE
ncbi:hypothetical protein CA13_45160 [Planctomycetes bacterium CA13]|uniref:Uncharacterized protein n=1 Tax=Novipirellula herctigrandis TaxID=2527986 RepID=A0A5C5Z940_9BACT|nr:hypothetical protein CA13_45160 [Planctomycetes bacterium CA13]